MRQFLFYGFVALFFMLATIILPYSFGYKLDLNGMTLQRTGMFYIKTTPNGATVYLNDQKQTSLTSRLLGQATPAATPVKLKNITPGTYQVRLELPGYWPWEKQLVVNPSETTYLQDVYFFKKSAPILVTPLNLADIKTTVASPDRAKIAVLTKTDLKIFAWDKITEPQTFSLPKNTASQIVWAPSNQKIAVGNFVIDLRNNMITDLNTLGAKAITKLVWVDDDTLYYQSNNDLKKIDLKANQVSAAFNQKGLYDFLIKDGYVYLIHDGANPSLDITKLSDSQAEPVATIKLSDSEKYKFVDFGQSNINIQTTASQKLYAITTKLPWFKDYTIDEIGAVTAGQWVGDSKLIFANDFELSLWAKGDDQPKLLTRISHPIMSLSWHKSNNYVVFATDKTINTLELDDRNNYNIATLLTLDQINYPIFNKEGSSVFFYSNIDGKSGLYLLEL